MYGANSNKNQKIMLENTELCEHKVSEACHTWQITIYQKYLYSVYFFKV